MHGPFYSPKGSTYVAPNDNLTEARECLEAADKIKEGLDPAVTGNPDLAALFERLETLASKLESYESERESEVESFRYREGELESTVSSLEEELKSEKASREEAESDLEKAEEDRDAALIEPEVECAACGSLTVTHLGQLGPRVHFRCRDCGMDFSRKS
jgi:predicted  nucleic acid-binding Zn-ribbon protein